MRQLIIDYELVRGSASGVEERVKQLINSQHGWQPKGNMKVIKIDNVEVVLQGMVQYES